MSDQIEKDCIKEFMQEYRLRNDKQRFDMLKAFHLNDINYIMSLMLKHDCYTDPSDMLQVTDNFVRFMK